MRFHGALGTVTGSAHFLHHVPTDRWLAIDCGLLQGERGLKGNLPEELPVSPERLAYLFITHAHLDHIGMLPAWIDAGFDGGIWCTRPTAELILVALDEIVRRATPPSSHSTAYYADFIQRRLICPDDMADFRFGQRREVCEGLDVALYPTAHVVGSVAFHFRASARTYRTSEICFLGDVGSTEDEAGGSLMPPRALPKQLPRTVVSESTYGDRTEVGGQPKDFASRQEALASALRATLSRGERTMALVPVFTMQRTTDVLLDLMALLRSSGAKLGLRSGEEVEVVVPSEGALAYAKVILKAYEQVMSSGERPWYNSQNLLLGAPAVTAADIDRQFDLLRRMLSPSAAETWETTDAGIRLRLTWGRNPPSAARLKIVLCSSGSTSFGTAHKLIYQHLDNPTASVLLVGYVPEDSIGGQLKQLLEPEPSSEPLMMPIPESDESMPWGRSQVALAVHNLSAWYSGHAARESLLRLLRGQREAGQLSTPLTVMLVHGRPLARLGMVRALKEEDRTGAWGHRIKHVHFPTQLSPQYDVGLRAFDAPGMTMVRTRGVLPIKTRSEDVVQGAFGRIRHILRDKHGLIVPRLETRGQLLAMARWGSAKYCRHQVMLNPISGHDQAIEVVVESDLAGCDAQDDFINRLFVWSELFNTSELKPLRSPFRCHDEESFQHSLETMVNGQKGVVFYSSRSSDREAAYNLCTYLAGGDTQVVIVEQEFWGRLGERGIQVGPWIANAVMPGLDPIPFTSDDYYGIAPVLVEAMNKAIPPQPFSLEVMNYGARLD